jgi:hypothetical protein
MIRAITACWGSGATTSPWRAVTKTTGDCCSTIKGAHEKAQQAKLFACLLVGAFRSWLSHDSVAILSVEGEAVATKTSWPIEIACAVWTLAMPESTNDKAASNTSPRRKTARTDKCREVVRITVNISLEQGRSKSAYAYTSGRYNAGFVTNRDLQPPQQKK